ncbi:outer membrane protein assembly factor BamB [Motilimonas pumila]|uniref:Outer membrane protein assembly factor BamB n=1 Tax=Motilimonas pumila TaxID=2303987 RepID=A0A418YB96_9GAMM|nr:outer membrane protein assembly factor BamB [Motilimonas pumila]RJG40246.1 outer membrane protein assembly factor BamB [Motilimonas pumila]
MDNWLKKIGLGIIAATMLQGCSLFDSEEDAVVMAELPSITQSYQPEILWQASVGNGVEDYYSQLQPAVIDGYLYAADRDGLVKSFDLETGKQRWQVDLSKHESNALNRGPRISGAIAAGYDAIYLGTENAQVFALDYDTGEVRWVADPKGEVIAKPLVVDSKVIVHTSRGDVYAFDEYSGEYLWAVPLSQPALTLRSSSEPVEVGGAVIYGRADGKLAAAFVNNGVPIWERAIASPKGATELDRIVDVDAKPIVINQAVYVIAYNGELMAINLSDGQTLWKRKYSAYNSMDVAGFVLFVSDEKDHLYAIDRRSGSEVWSNTQLEYRVLTSPVVAGSYIMVGDSEGYLHWLNWDGEFVAQQELDSKGLYSAPIIVDDKIILQTRSGKIFALKKP